MKKKVLIPVLLFLVSFFSIQVVNAQESGKQNYALVGLYIINVHENNVYTAGMNISKYSPDVITTCLSTEIDTINRDDVWVIIPFNPSDSSFVFEDMADAIFADIKDDGTIDVWGQGVYVEIEDEETLEKKAYICVPSSSHLNKDGGDMPEDINIFIKYSGGDYSFDLGEKK